MLCTWPRGEVVAAFSDQLQREVRTEAVDRGDIISEQRDSAPLLRWSWAMCFLAAVSSCEFPTPSSPTARRRTVRESNGFIEAVKLAACSITRP